MCPGDWINSPCVVTSLEHGCSMIAQGSYHHDTDDADECGVSDLLTGGMEYLKVSSTVLTSIWMVCVNNVGVTPGVCITGDFVISVSRTDKTTRWQYF